MFFCYTKGRKDLDTIDSSTSSNSPNKFCLVEIDFGLSPWLPSSGRNLLSELIKSKVNTQLRLKLNVANDGLHLGLSYEYYSLLLKLEQFQKAKVK